MAGLTETTKPPTVAPNRVARASTKKRRKPVVLFVLPVVLVLLGAGVLLFLGGGTDAIPIIGNGGSDDPVPPFDFKVKKAAGISSVAEFDKDALAAQADAVGAEVTPTIDDLFTNAFLDPSNWREGDYEEVFEAFAPISVASAQGSVETITLGTAAGELFKSVEPDKGSLEYRVLFDPEGNPESVVVRYRFYATAERTDGTFLGVFSHGQLYLSEVDGWKITAFDFIRADRDVVPTATGATGASGGTGTSTGSTTGSTTGASGATGTS